mgnify:FL=1
MAQGNPRLEFEPIEHKYNLVYKDGAIERIPSVSEIIEPLIDYTTVGKDVMTRACEYGTNVHSAIEQYLKCTLDEAALDEGLRKPLDGFKKWYENDPLFTSEGFGGCSSESRFFHPKLKYAGTIDLMVRGVAIVDFKTRKFNKIVDTVRLAAYRGLLPDFPPLQTFVLEINTEGETKLVNAHHKHAWGIFRKLYEFNKRKREMEILIHNWR